MTASLERLKEGSVARYKKLKAEAEGFVRACQTNSSLAADKVLDDLIFRACPNIPSRDKSTLIGRIVSEEGA